jgi:hypothetical protein
MKSFNRSLEPYLLQGIIQYGLDAGMIVVSQVS